MRVLIACECSGRVRDAFIRRGHDAWSCDTKPSEVGGPHIQGNVLDHLDGYYLGHGRSPVVWDLLIAHPPCTYLCVAGIHWTVTGGRDPKLTDDAIAFFKLLLKAPVERICVENPIGVCNTRIRKPTQIIQPYQFGKKTGLWLKNLPPLRQTGWVPPRIVRGLGRRKLRWGNQADASGSPLRQSNKEKQSTDRARTYMGIAEAMAAQWSNLPPVEKGLLW